MSSVEKGSRGGRDSAREAETGKQRSTDSGRQSESWIDGLNRFCEAECDRECLRRGGHWYSVRFSFEFSDQSRFEDFLQFLYRLRTYDDLSSFPKITCVPGTLGLTVELETRAQNDKAFSEIIWDLTQFLQGITYYDRNTEENVSYFTETVTLKEACRNGKLIARAFINQKRLPDPSENRCPLSTSLGVSDSASQSGETPIPDSGHSATILSFPERNSSPLSPQRSHFFLAGIFTDGNTARDLFPHLFPEETRDRSAETISRLRQETRQLQEENATLHHELESLRDQQRSQAQTFMGSVDEDEGGTSPDQSDTAVSEKEQVVRPEKTIFDCEELKKDWTKNRKKIIDPETGRARWQNWREYLDSVYDPETYGPLYSSDLRIINYKLYNRIFQEKTQALKSGEGFDFPPFFITKSEEVEARTQASDGDYSKIGPHDESRIRSSLYRRQQEEQRSQVQTFMETVDEKLAPPASADTTMSEEQPEVRPEKTAFDCDGLYDWPDDRQYTKGVDGKRRKENAAQYVERVYDPEEFGLLRLPDLKKINEPLYISLTSLKSRRGFDYPPYISSKPQEVTERIKAFSGEYDDISYKEGTQIRSAIYRRNKQLEETSN